MQSLNRATRRFALLLGLDSLHFVALSLEPLVGVKEGSFQQDLAHCSKIVRKHHSKRSASPSQSVQEPAERPPVYGLGFVAGPTTIVAGTRGSVRIGFQATIGRLNTAETRMRAAAKKRISLGKYSDGELRSMFDGNRASVAPRKPKRVNGKMSWWQTRHWEGNCLPWTRIVRWSRRE